MCNKNQAQQCLPPLQCHPSRQHLLVLPCPGFIYLFGVLCRFQHCTGHITTGSLKGRGNQYIQFVRVLYCKLPTNGKQLPAFPLKAVMGIEPRPQRWEARVLPLCHRGPSVVLDILAVDGTVADAVTVVNAVAVDGTVDVADTVPVEDAVVAEDAVAVDGTVALDGTP